MFGEALGSLGNMWGMPALWFYRGGPEALEPIDGHATRDSDDSEVGPIDQYLEAFYLSPRGAAPGDRLGVSLPNDSRIVVLFHAAMRAGAVWVGLNRALTGDEQAAVLDDCRALLTIGCAPSPDRTALEKVFPSTDNIKSVYAFVRSCLREDVKPIKFVLCELPSVT